MRFQIVRSGSAIVITRTGAGAPGPIMITGISEGDFTEEERAANLPFRYTECMHAALQSEFGTAEPAPPPADLGYFAGVKIPEAFRDRADLLYASTGREARERTPEQNMAVTQFIEYCDAEGIALAAKPAPDADDLNP